MTDISIDRTRFRLLLAKGEIIVNVLPDSYTGPLRDIDISGWWPGMSETLQRIYDLPTPASSLDPLVDQYFSAAASLGGWWEIYSFIDDERIERWGWSSDKEAMLLHGERVKEVKVAKAMAVLDKVPDVPPDPGDELPEGWERTR